MDGNRRPARHLVSPLGPSRDPTGNSFRASTAESGLESIAPSERTATLDSRATNGTSSSLSRDTPLNDHEETVRKESHDDRPIRIHPTRVVGNRCYQQAYVSYIDHPSAFFLQLPDPDDRFPKLDQEINEFYSKSPMPDPPVRWKRGDYCIAKDKDNKFYRARIVEIPEVTKKPGLYDVVFLDFGNWDKVASTNIHVLQPKFATLPAQAIPCSLAKSLPVSGTWFDHPLAIKVFEGLVLDKYVDATVYSRSSRDYWQLPCVDLNVSSSKLHVRTSMYDSKLAREVPNEKIYEEFNHLLKPVDMIIYSIQHDAEGNDDDDDYC